jgi:maltose alpha-D-glucosyltransferase/alpha-amylase
MRARGRTLSGEQSNTSVLFGETAIAKVYRKLQPGINPDSEITSFLTERADFPHVPAFLGSIELIFDDGRESIEIASVQRFVPNQGDSWRWLPGALAAASDQEREALTGHIELLGRRTAELHQALAADDASEAFRPAGYVEGDVIEFEERLGREARQTASALHRQGAASYTETEALSGELLSGISRAGVLKDSLRTRVHGDYHLGQVLRTNDDFVIIDFEGEPSRSMSERRMKHSPLKDVAGMLRSIDYAVASTLMTVDVDRRTAIEDWRTSAVEAFLRGYITAMEQSPLNLVPSDPKIFQQSLDLFMIEKALYEVRYELDNRPDWLEIPLGALRRIGASN